MSCLSVLEITQTIACVRNISTEQAAALFRWPIPRRYLHSRRLDSREYNRQQRNAFLRVEIDHPHSQGTQPLDPALKVPAFPDHHCAECKLAHQTAAIPAGRERASPWSACDSFLCRPAFRNRVGLSVHRRTPCCTRRLCPAPASACLSRRKIAAPMGMPPSFRPRRASARATRAWNGSLASRSCFLLSHRARKSTAVFYRFSYGPAFLMTNEKLGAKRSSSSISAASQR